MDQDAIVRYIQETFEGVDAVVGSKEAGDPELAWGDTFFSYDPNGIFRPIAGCLS